VDLLRGSGAILGAADVPVDLQVAGAKKTGDCYN
jgi:hypothetical protein